MQSDRLKKLARHLDRLAAQDREVVRREQEIQALRLGAAGALHALCSAFVSEVNSAVTAVQLEISPPEFPAETFQPSSTNLFQINISGRVIQLVFEGTEPLLTTENLRTPYTLEGAIRWFNQDMLSRDEIKDQQLFYCVDRRGNEWRYYDPRTHRSGTVDEDYLASILEQLV